MQVLVVSKPYKLASREFHPDPTVIRVGDAVIMAGPCSVEDEEQMVTTAKAVKAAGAHGLLVEVHPNPEVAKCDGAQLLTFENFNLLMDQVKAINSVRQVAVLA